jgi:hypothetical protein
MKFQKTHVDKNSNFLYANFYYSNISRREKVIWYKNKSIIFLQLNPVFNCYRGNTFKFLNIVCNKYKFAG